MRLNLEAVDVPITASPHTKSTPSRNRGLFVDAKRLAAAGHYTSANAILTEYLSVAPDDLSAWAIRSVIADSLDEKLNAFSQMLSLDPDHPYASYGLDLLTNISIDVVDEIPHTVFGAQPALSIRDIASLEEEIDFSIHETEAAPFLEQVFDVEEEEIMTVYFENCPFCTAALHNQAFACDDCGCALSLSDIEPLLSRRAAGNETVLKAVSDIESSRGTAGLAPHQLSDLGIGYLNLGEFEKGLACLNEASRKNPNDVILAGQVNAIAIRIEEIRRQDEAMGSMARGKTILVVDDSATVRKLISSKLEKAGHNVVCATDGLEAMSSLESVVPDLVLLDINMPNMDGYQVCKLIRAKESLSDVPVVMISGNDGFFDKVRGKMAGTTDYITKPFGPETLMKALDTYLMPAANLA